MTDDGGELQGLWRLESITSTGQKVHSSVTHWEFEGGRVQQIVPSFVDGGTWATFVQDTTTTPKHLDITHTYTKPNSDETFDHTYKYAYVLDGDVLRIGGPRSSGQYPESLNDTDMLVTTLRRTSEPRPQTKQASGIAPVESAVLGTVTWNDNFNYWEARFAIAPGQTVKVSLDPLDSAPDQTIEKGEQTVRWAQEHEADARAYAAEQMTDLAEDWREEEDDPDPITPESFARRITLESLSLGSDGGITFWYDDGDIFAGHVIVVSVDANRQFTDAEMMG